VRIGLGYTAVLLEDNRAGVAFTFRQEVGGGCSVFHGLRPLSARPASDLLHLLESTDLIEAAVGLACANALVNQQNEKLQDGDILERLELKSDDHVGMVGHFGPLVDALQQRARSLTVFERIKEPHGYLRPAEEAEDWLPRCQVGLITGTSIINRTIDPLLDAAKHCREVVILGASTPMLPEAFSTAKVTLLSGVIVKSPGEVLRVVSEGGGMRLFRPYIQKVNLSNIMDYQSPLRGSGR
ncbi:MAG: DUF364 domain-containing protein, partial [Candidatus Eisenbacteria sp.]|nr:DUF364 domain-containing protein [Candidatus Eisenbacteria bacterium]